MDNIQQSTPHQEREPGVPAVNNVSVSGNSLMVGPFATAGTYHIICLIHRGMGMTYTLNSKVFPSTGMIMVTEGQLIKLHFDNQSDLYHPMHLHGHVMTVLDRNRQPLTGSSIHQDTLLVPPHTTYDVAFLANNPGIWMLHCHNLLHADCAWI